MDKILTQRFCIHMNCKAKAVKPHPKFKDDLSKGLCETHYSELIDTFHNSQRPILIYPYGG